MPDNHNVNILNPIELRGYDGSRLPIVPVEAVVVVPSASTVLKAGILFVGVGGDILLRPVGQDTLVLFKNVPDGSFLPVLVDMVSNNASTTATNMLICY